MLRLEGIIGERSPGDESSELLLSPRDRKDASSVSIPVSAISDSLFLLTRAILRKTSVAASLRDYVRSHLGVSST
jgi:hypothetical protein